MARIVKFAIATAMRQEEIFRVTGSDLNKRTKMLTIALIEERRIQRKEGDDRIFPYNHKSAGTNFTRACQALEIQDLLFHDLRHEGTSRLFEAGLAIQQVALVTGHKDWKMLRRYTHLKAASLHAFLASRAA